MDPEQVYRLTLSNGSIVEVYEHKYGFNPQVDTVTMTVRRRFHLIQSTNHSEQLWLLHYLRSPEQDHIKVSLEQSRPQPPRQYPLPELPNNQFFLGSQIQPPVVLRPQQQPQQAQQSTQTQQQHGGSYYNRPNIPAAAPGQPAYKRARMNSLPIGTGAELLEGQDEFDIYSLRDGAAVRYRWLGELMEEVLGSAHHTKDITLSKVTLGEETPQNVKDFMTRLEANMSASEESHKERVAAFKLIGQAYKTATAKLEKVQSLEELEMAQADFEAETKSIVAPARDDVIERLLTV